MSLKNSVSDLIEEGKVLPDIIVPSDNFNFKKFRMAYKNEDGTSLSQAQCAKDLGVYDANIISKYERNELRVDNRTYTVFLLLTKNHPIYELNLRKKYTKTPKLLFDAPTPEEIKEMRLSVGLQQKQASNLLDLHEKQFGKYESTTAKSKNRRAPTSHTWTLFLLMVNKHPYYKLVEVQNK